MIAIPIGHDLRMAVVAWPSDLAEKMARRRDCDTL